MELPANIKSIIIFRALQLGDMLCVIPAIRSLRHAYPNALITLAGLPWAKSFTDRFDKYFDNFIWFPGYPGLPEQHLKPKEFTKFLDNVQHNNYDLALQMQGNGSIVNSMVALFGAKITAGFFIKEDYAANTDYFMEYPDYGSEIERHLQLMSFLGVANQGNELEFPITKQDELEYNSLKLPIESKQYVCIHPGSRGSWRQWPVEHFASIADYCVNSGLKVVVTGTQDELEIVNKVISLMKQPAINLAGKTSLGVMALLIKNSYALISNCTGVSHIAAAFKTASIVISMDGEPERWGPVNKEIHHTINWLDKPDFEYVYHQTMNMLRSGLITNKD